MLKPSELRITGSFSYANYETQLFKSINQLSDKKVSGLILSILNSNNNTKITLGNVNNNVINEIKNYLGESAGPYFIKKFNLENFIVKSNSKIYFPTSQTESLYDFSLNDILYSVKQLKGATNVLKPGDVVKAIKKDKGLFEIWGSTPVFKTFEILNEKNVISGPISVIREVYPDKTNLNKNELDIIIDQMTKNDVVINNPPAKLVKMIKADSTTKQNLLDNGFISGTAVNFLFEKILIEISKNDNTFNQLFLAATSGNIKFLKFGLTNAGVFSVVVIDPAKSGKVAYLRSKQGVERRSSSGALKLDKLGFQP